MTLLLMVAAATVAVCALLRVVAPRSERVLTPASSTVLLPVLACAAAVSTLAAAVAIAAVMWQADPAVAQVCGIVVAGVVGWRLLLAAGHTRRVVASSHRAAAFGMAADRTTGLLVLDDDIPDAFASPAGGGAIVITTGLIGELSDDELGAVLAHERAHLRYRHHVGIQASEIAAQLVPILRPITDVVRHAAERHADECAARAGRRIAMMAVARASIVCARGGDRSAGIAPLASTGGDVVRRVRALSAPPPDPQRRLVVVVAAAVVVGVLGLGVALVDVSVDVVSPEQGEAAAEVFR